ncbi:MAG: helix-turn-helix transcriptional regulator [Coleofasciculaceae cyanobacterium]
MTLVQSYSLDSFLNTSERQQGKTQDISSRSILLPELTASGQDARTTNSQTENASDNALLVGIIESFLDGILILTEQGECIQSNRLALQICQQLSQITAPSNSVPEEIWKACQALIESQSFYPGQPINIESEITLKNLTTLRIRVRRFKLNGIPHPCLLVILEDRCKSVQKLAISEVDKYGLTSREAEVWLLRRANYSYQEIADELYISINTVKKHMKNIQAKREAVE